MFSFLRRLRRTLQPFLAIHPIGAFEVHDMALGHEQVVQRRTAVARVALGQLLEPLTQRPVVTSLIWSGPNVLSER
jgi:hypothetical protein